MAKKTPVKKSKRGLKRSVRRSLAAVLMITAIGVAAIPVPENFAAPEDGIMTRAVTTDVHNTDAAKFVYGEAGDDNYDEDLPDKGSTTFSLGKYDTDAKLAAATRGIDYFVSYSITNIANDTATGEEYSLGWQFMYYPTKDPRNTQINSGVICKYNNQYYSPTVELPMLLITEYFTVKQSDITAYFDRDDKTSPSKSLNMDMSPGPDAAVKYSYKYYVGGTVAPDPFLTDYFEYDFSVWKQGCDEYTERKNAYEEEHGPDSFTEAEPDDFSRTPSIDLKDETQQVKYFTEHCGVLNAATAEGGNKFTLYPVTDATPDSSGGRVYLAKGGTLSSTGLNKYFEGDFGFLASEKSDYTMCAIGNRAFAGVKNVENMVIPTQIGYIGNEAFQNAEMLQSVTLNNVEMVGNRAFQGCVNLTTVDVGSTTATIGKECFSGDTKLQSIKFGTSMQRIGYGAFYNCVGLTSVTFADDGQPCEVGAFAFYNCEKLATVTMQNANISKLEKGAFAVEGSSVLENIVMSRYLSAADGIGDFLFSGRSSLKTVVFPQNFGRSAKADIPDNVFHGCVGLKWVEFPCNEQSDPWACGNVWYDPKKLFADVIQDDFYVKGPKRGTNVDPARPRECTWDAVTAVSSTVPYLYIEGGVEYYEVSDGFYLLCINDKGILTSCTFKSNESTDWSRWLKDPDWGWGKDKKGDAKEGDDGAVYKNWGGESGKLVIPAVVGNTKIVGIASNCFSDTHLNCRVQELRIEDNSISEIADGVFRGGGGSDSYGKDWQALAKVYIGNSVNSIGANAFRDCISLIDVTFASPLGGYEAFTIGTDAFNTQSPELTFHGDIVDGYAPFEWAMDPSNVIEAKNGLRVCYKSLAPTYLTVMYNPITKMVTLLDYPKYSEIDSILQEQFADEIEAARCRTYTEWREKTLYDETFGTAAYDGSRERFAIAWQAALSAGDSAAVELAKSEVYANRELYGPWVNPRFCEGGWKGYLSSSGTTSEDSSESSSEDSSHSEDLESGSLGGRISDFLFKPIVAYAADENPTPYYTANPYNVTYAVNGKDNFFMPTTEESGLVYYTTNIEVPAGVESIDVFGYVKDYTAEGEEYTDSEDSNIANYNTYLYNSWDSLSRDMYERQFAEDEDNIRSVPGLFSGFYDDVKASVPEERKRGNDVIRSVTMYTVKYLPDYAFDSCEGLNYVILGSECSDIGKAPFRGCYALTTVGNNDYYTTDNGIIYSHNTDGSLTIEECLSGRGNVVGAGTVNSLFDPNLSNVSAIKPGAFEDCDYLSEVNFGSNDTAGLTEIPEDCFRNCDLLSKVTLPMTVNDVGPNSFVGANSLNELVVYGKEVKISGRAFRNNLVNNKPERTRTTVRTYSDSAVVRYVKEYGKEYNLVLDEVRPLGEIWQVSFYDGNYALIEELKDRDGNILDNPQYVEDGDRPTEPVAPEMEGWTFDRWVGSNNVKLGDAIHEDTAFYAQGYSESGMVGGKYPVTFWDGIDGKQVGPTQYIAPGSDAIAPAHPVHAGYQEDGFSDTYTNVQSPKTIIMKYKVSGTSGGSTPGTSSNNSSNTSNAGTSTSTSSGSTSTSSTSSGSTTSGSSEVGKYTVTVENGSGSGSYDVGSTVIIAANTAPAGMVFKNWTTESNGVALASVSMTATTFTMPANNVTVTANYVTATANSVNTGSTGSVGNTGNTGNNGNNSNGSTRVDITKPGISNKDLATANTNGSTDNFVVKITETDEATRAVAEALTNKYGSLENILYYAMDISLYDSTGTVKISDTTGLTVDITIPIPDALVAYGGNNMAGAVINGNQLENLNENFTTINGVPCIRFTATHFSPYTIYVDTGNLTEGMLDVTPKTGDPIHPKWFLSIGLACLSVILFMKKDKAVKVKTA